MPNRATMTMRSKTPVSGRRGIGPRVFWLFPLFGLAMLTIGGVNAAQTIALEWNAIRVTGQVVGLKPSIIDPLLTRDWKQRRYCYRQSDYPDRIKQCQPVQGSVTIAMFVAADGVMRTVAAKHVVSPAPHAIGDPVTITYPVGRPEMARISDFTENWFLPLMFGGIGLAFCALCLFLPRFISRAAEKTRVDTMTS